MKWMITCKEATKFISQQEEKKLSAGQTMRLWLHIGICGVCKIFYRQNKIIIQKAPDLSAHTQASLTVAEKETIVFLLNEETR